MRRPSATAVVRGRALRERVRCVRWGEEPRWRRISFRAWRLGGVRGWPVEVERRMRRRLRRRMRAGRVGPWEMPRWVGQGGRGEDGGGGSVGDGGVERASWTERMECRGLGAPDM